MHEAMIGYLIRRTGQAAVVLIGVSVIGFLLLHLLPGGPARAILGNQATSAEINAFNVSHGLLKPLPLQYLAWLNQLIHLSLGFSFKTDQSVNALLAENVPPTLILVGISTLLALSIAVPLGAFQASRRNKPDDLGFMGLSLLLYSMPSFLLGTILIIVLSQWIHVLPSTGPSASYPLWTQVPSLVLPILTLTLTTVALFSRYMRSSVLENLVQDYVRTARAKGASSTRILFVHVLRNSILPIITLVGLNLRGIFSGAVIVEALFNYPGMGLLFWNSATSDDFPVMLGTTMVVGAAVVVGSLAADVLYSVSDPRVRYS